MASLLDIPRDLDSIRQIKKSDVLPSQSVCRYTGAPGATRYYLMRCPICLSEGHTNWDLSAWNVHMLDAGHAAYQNITGRDGVEKVIRLAGAWIVDADRSWWEVELKALRMFPAGTVPTGLDEHGFVTPSGEDEQDQRAEREILLRDRERILDAREKSLREMEAAISTRAGVNAATEIALAARENALDAREFRAISGVPSYPVHHVILWVCLIPDAAVISALLTVPLWLGHGWRASGLRGIPWTSVKRIAVVKQRVAKIAFDANLCVDPVMYLKTFCGSIAQDMVGRPLWVEFLAYVVEGKDGEKGVLLWAALDEVMSAYFALFVVIYVAVTAWKWRLAKERL